MRKFLGASIVAFALLLGIGFAGVIGFADDFGDVEELPVFAVQEGLVWIGECVSTEETASQFQNADDCDDGITSLKLAPETRQAIEFHVTYPLTIDTAKWYVSFFLTLDKGLTWSDRVFVNLSLKELDPDLDGNIKISGSRFTINAFDASAMTRLTVLDRKLTPGIVNSRVWVFDGPVHGEVQDGIPVQDGLVSPTVAFGSGNRPSNPTPKDQQGTTTPHCSVNCDNSGKLRRRRNVS
ncbi:MAG: hypothetical protein UY09_C0005G0011 [Parcubacteria group bacterium GW2011_GWA2_47_8]|nr:MAG: hypothetical protein UY09_C0005G0011 [Parcubacteria group bacterium GW2011_GWA2_47_8]